MQLFIDSANLTDIEETLKRGFIRGITTNPSILSKEQRIDVDIHIRNIIELIRKYNWLDLPLSIELSTNTVPEMIQQTLHFAEEFRDYEGLYIKVPIGWNELEVIQSALSLGVKVNCTCCMSYNQAIMAANAGANYVSLFWGRIRDTGYDAASVVRAVHTTLVEWNSPTKIIVGSIRQMIDINEAIQAGADIVTVPPKFFQLMCQHPKTDEVVAQFLQDFSTWSAQPNSTLSP